MITANGRVVLAVGLLYLTAIALGALSLGLLLLGVAAFAAVSDPWFGGPSMFAGGVMMTLFGLVALGLAWAAGAAGSRRTARYVRVATDPVRAERRRTQVSIAILWAAVLLLAVYGAAQSW